MAYNSTSQHPEEHEESYFVSMTDMMVGMLFLFIIMLMFFAMKFSDDSVDLREQIRQLGTERDKLRTQLALLQGTQLARKEIVEKVYLSLREQGVTVLIDRDNGILRLPESILFPKGHAELSPGGKEAVAKLAKALNQVLPCYSSQPDGTTPAQCPPSAFGLEALLVEGHTDSDGSEEMNWRLSMERSLHTYQVMTREYPSLGSLCSRQTRQDQGKPPSLYPLMSVAGYGLKRPVAPNDTEENKQRNRRIDIRFIMTPPSEQTVNMARRLLE